MNILKSVLLASLLAVPLAAAAASTSPGKSSVFATENATLDAGGNITPVVATITKGKAKTVVKVDITVTTASDAAIPAVLGIATINGAQGNVETAYAQCVAGSTWPCTVSSSYWFDIDALELAAPGSFAGQPLVIQLTGGNASFGGTGVPYFASIAAQVVKK